MYTNTHAQMCINGTLTEKFNLCRGCRQGCLLFPFLFNLSTEPFAEALWTSKGIFGIDIGKIQNRISLYADDIILYLTSPEKSIPVVLDLIDKFGRISGYKINFGKSNAFLLNSPISNNLKAISPFAWTQNGFKYLGVNVSPRLEDLFIINYSLWLQKMKEELEHWNLLPISLLRQINVIKMNILPRFNYLFQSLPCYLHKTFFKSINKLLSSFIWKNSSPRKTFKTLTKSKGNGGLGLPDLQLYYWAAQTKCLSRWIQKKTTHLTDIEEELCLPSSLITLPFINNINALNSVSSTYVVYNTLRAWQDVKKFCGSGVGISLLAPLSSNPDFPPSVAKSMFKKWREFGLEQFQHLFIKNSLKTFLDLRSEFGIPKQDFHKYWQSRHLITVMKRAGRLSSGLSKMEEILKNSTWLKGKSSLIYNALLEHHSSSLTSLKTGWQKDLVCDFSDDQWNAMCQNVFSSLSCNKIIEQNYHFMHRMYLTQLCLSKIYPRYVIDVKHVQDQSFMFFGIFLKTWEPFMELWLFTYSDELHSDYM